MKKWILILVVIALAGGGAYYYSAAQKKTKRNDRTTQVVTATIGTIEDTVQATGVVQPLNRVEIKPPISGRIENLKVDEGDKVNAGQILGWMSSTDRAAILDAARAKGPRELKRWEDTYKPTPIIAPLSGTIILRNVVVGQTVDGGTIIYAMSDKLIVRANVDETDIGRITMKMPVRITLDSFPTEPIEGVVFQILHEGINVSNVITYPVKIEPKNVPPFFRSQMTANISLISNKKDAVVLVPATAVSVSAGGEKHVMVPGPEGKPVRQAVRTGLENDESIEIVSGLKEGDKVLIITKRYTPQNAAATSPLVSGGPRPSQGQTQGQTQGQGQGRRAQ